MITVAKAKTLVSQFARDEAGVTAIEYGMIAAGIAVGIMVTVFALGDDLNSMYANIDSEIQAR